MASSKDSLEQKKSLRQEIRKRLKALSLDERRSRSQQLSLNLQNFLIQMDQLTSLGAFWPLSDEVDWTSAWRASGLQLFFPGGDKLGLMMFFQAEIGDFEERKTDFGVMMKVPRSTSVPGVPQALLIPGVGFDLQGSRLGRGGGYYDRYLESYRGMKIGVCFECQVVERIYCEPHDQKMDVLITEERVAHFTSE